jgi:PKD repeat protein
MGVVSTVASPDILIGRGSNRRRSGAEAQALAEFALVLPILILLMLIAVDFGRLFFTYIQVNNAAREGAAYGAGMPSDANLLPGGGGIRQSALQEANVQVQRGENPITVGASCADSAGVPIVNCADAPGGAGPGNKITVTVDEKFNFFTPLINGAFGDNLHVVASATAAVLGYAATGTGTPGGCTAGPTIAAFTATVNGMTVAFDASASRPDTGNCAISGYNWNWGDGSDPYLQEGKQFSYTYGGAGSYTVELVVTNQAGSLIATQTVIVGGAGPTPTPTPTPAPTPAPTPTPTPPPNCSVAPNFAWQNDKASDPTVAFQGSYSGIPAPNSWHWTFGDGTSATGQTVSHTYVGSSLPSNKKVTVALTVQTNSCQRTFSDEINLNNGSG